MTRIPGRLRGWLASPRLPKRTVRLRLTILYTGLFVLSGVVLLAVTYLLFESLNGPALRSVSANPTASGVTGSLIPQQLRHLPLPDPGATQRSADAHQLVIDSGIALTVVTALALVLGWVIAGRVLRPLRFMTSTTQHISEDNLNERLALPGPQDELKDLGDTIDGLLGRLEGAFEAQRNFVANASHELRTPLTITRALMQMRLRDAEATVASYRATCKDVLEAVDEQEHLIESLLTLARSQRGLDHRESIELETLVANAVEDYDLLATRRGICLTVLTHPAGISGDPYLVERLVANLIENAIQYNEPGGFIHISTHNQHGKPTIEVVNSGPPIAEEQMPRLLQPFQRASTDRSAEHSGQGLGLAIVAAIAQSHDASLAAVPRNEGGLSLMVVFSAPSRI